MTDANPFKDRPEPGPLYAIGVWAGLILGGIGAGSGLAWLVAPGSDFALFVGLATLPVLFGLSLKAWMAAASAVVTKRFFGAAIATLLGRKDFATAVQDSVRDLEGRMPGTGVFLPFGLAGGLVAGALTALADTSIGLGACLGGWLALAVGYALLMRWLARTGRLPMPE